LVAERLCRIDRTKPTSWKHRMIVAYSPGPSHAPSGRDADRNEQSPNAQAEEIEAKRR
jgi:hypothetical protein